MEVSTRVKCCYQMLVSREMRKQAKLNLRVVAFNSGADFHAATAARVFGVPVEEVTPALRSRAKAVNFGIVYGQHTLGDRRRYDTR